MRWSSPADHLWSSSRSLARRWGLLLLRKHRRRKVYFHCMKVSQSLLFFCFTLLLVGCSSLEERQEKTSEWWNGFFGTGSGMVQNLKSVYDGMVRQVHATVQI